MLSDKNWPKELKQIIRAMERLPPESCPPKVAEIIVMLSDRIMPALKGGEASPMTSSIAQEIIGLYGKSIPYAPKEKRDAMRARIVECCRNFAKQEFTTLRGDACTRDYTAAMFLGFAIPYAPGSERDALHGEFVSAFINAVKEGGSTAGYGGKRAKLWENGLRLPPLSEGMPAACAGILKNTPLPEGKLDELRYEVARVFADKARHAGNGDYHSLLERTYDALSWLPGQGEKARPALETLAIAYLEAGNAAKGNDTLAAAILFRIARDFKCSDETKKAINRKFAQIKPILLALKSNSHNFVDGGPTLRGWFAGALAGDRLNGIRILGELLLKYSDEPIHLHRIKYSDVNGCG